MGLLVLVDLVGLVGLVDLVLSRVTFKDMVRRPQNLKKKSQTCFDIHSVMSKQVGDFLHCYGLFRKPELYVSDAFEVYEVFRN